MADKKTIFLTGATGLVGSYLLKLLLQNDNKVYVLARSKDSKSASDRVINILSFWDKEILSKRHHNLIVLEGDITRRNLGLTIQSIDSLTNVIDEIFHCAAIINYSRKIRDIRKVNVLGTKNILDFASKCKVGNSSKVNYISSAYICGDYKGKFSEKDLNVNQQFNSTYELSKFESEKLIQVYREKGLWIDIFRPSIVIGESTTGKIPVFEQHFYQVLRIWKLGLFDSFPGRDYFANMVNVDDLCKGLVAISSNTSVKNGNYHLFSSQKISLEKVFNIFRNFMGLEKTKTVSMSKISELDLTHAQKIILKKLLLTFNGYANLDSEMTEGVLRKYGFIFSKIDKAFFYKTFAYVKDTKTIIN